MMKRILWIPLLFCLVSFFAFASGEPTIVSSVFSSYGSSVVTTFDSPVANTSLNVPFKCGVVFATATVSSLGADSACYWESESVLVAVLGSSSTVSVGSTVATTGAFGASQVALAAPTTPEPPVIDILGPATITTCEQPIVLSYVAQLLEGSKGVALNDGITWSIAAVDGGALPTTLTSAFVATKARVVHISASLFEPGNYVISATATNMLGASSTATYNVFKSTEMGPITMIQAPSTITIDPATPFSLKGQLVSLCQVQRQLTFSWSQVTGVVVPLTSSSRLNNELYFPANTFDFGNTYQLRFSAGQLHGSSVITITTISQFHARVVPTFMTISRVADVVVDASSSVVPTSANFSWSCYNINTPTVSCLDSAAEAAYLGNRKKLIVPASTLHEGTYVFTVVIEHGAQSESATSVVTLLHEAAPTVSISPSSEIVNPTIVNVFSSPSYSNIVSYKWTISPSVPLSYSDSASVEIGANALQQGVSYTLQLAVKTSNRNASETITFVADIAPFGGACSANGISASQYFIQCEDWKVLDPNGLLFYHFSYYDEFLKAEIPLHGTPSLSNFIIATLPARTNIVFARVSVGKGTQGAVVNITVSPRSLSEVTLGNGNITVYAADLVATNAPTLSYSRNADSIGQFVCFIGSLLESDSQDSVSGDRVWIRSQLTTLLAKSYITVDSPAATLAKANFLHYAVGSNHEEIDEQSQQNAHTVAHDIVYSNSYNGYENAVSKLTMATLSVIIRASAESQVIDVESEEYTQNKTSFNVPQTSDFIATMADAAVIALLSPVSNTSYESEYARVFARKDLPSSVPTTIVYEGVNVTLPQSAVTQILSTSPSYVVYLFIAFPSNPFAWANTSSTMNSPVVEFSIKTDSSTFKLEGLSEPIRIVVPSVTKYVNFAYARCQFWNPVEQVWSIDGCTVGAYDAAQTNCFCNHLSVFSAAQGAIPPPPVLSPPVLLGDDGTIQWWLFAGVTGFALLVVLGFIAYRMRAKNGVPHKIERGPTKLFAKQIRDIEANFKYGPVLKKVHIEGDDATDESEVDGEITEKVRVPLVTKPRRVARKTKPKKPPPKKVVEDRSRSASPEIKRGKSTVYLPIVEAPKVAVLVEDTPTPTPRVVTPPPRRVITPPPAAVPPPREPSPPKQTFFKLKPVAKPAAKPVPPPKPKPVTPPREPSPPPPPKEPTPPPTPIKEDSEDDELRKPKPSASSSSSSDSEDAEHMRTRPKRGKGSASESSSEDEELGKKKVNAERSDSSDTSSDSDSNERGVVKAKAKTTPFGTKNASRSDSDSSSTSSDSDDDIKKPAFAKNFGSVRGKPALRIAEQSSSSDSGSDSDERQATKPPARQPARRISSSSSSDSDDAPAQRRPAPSRLTRKDSSSSASSASSASSGPKRRPARKNSSSSASSNSDAKPRAPVRKMSDSDSSSSSSSDSDSDKSKDGYISPRGKRGSKTLSIEMTKLEKEEREQPITSRSARYSLMAPINPVNPVEEDALASPRHSLSMSPVQEEEDIEVTKKKDVRVTPLKLTTIRKSEQSEERESGSSKSHREMI